MKPDKILFLIVLLAIFFRFFRLFDFQYWSVDEEIFVAVVRQIAVNHKLFLISPNVAVIVSLGSFFHLLSAPIFLLANLTASKILIAGSILGVLTTLVVYKTGKEIGGLVVGRIASFLYAVSFLAAFSDRRWWPLSLDPLLGTLSVLSVINIIRGKHIYALVLAICASFAWHADPSLSVILVFTLLSVFFFKIPLLKKNYLPALAYLLFSFSPLIFFEFRHPGSITHPLMELISRPLSSGTPINRAVDIVQIIQSFARSLFLMSGKNIELYLGYLKSYPAPLISPLAEIAITVLALLSFNQINKIEIKVLYLYLFSFLLGLLVFTLGLGSTFHQHYFVIVWPVFFILLACSLSSIKRPYALVFLFLVLVSNTYTLFFSSMRYPLVLKEQKVNQALTLIDDKPFSLTVASADRMFEGFGGLFFLKNHYPSNADYYEAWDWIYRAYSLYEVPISKGPFEKHIIISP